MYTVNQLAWRLLRSRRDLEWHQEDLAEKSGISRTYISEIERGRITNVGIEAIFALAAALGVTPQYLLGLDDDPLGEGDAAVLKEQSGEYIAVDADTDEERQQLRRLIEDFTALAPRDRTLALAYLRMMRQIEQEEARATTTPPHLIGDT